jgi:hypothetical protein
MDNLTKILHTCLYESNQSLRINAESQLNNLVLNLNNLEVFFQYLLNNNIDNKLRVLLSVYIKNYVKSYFVREF